MPCDAAGTTTDRFRIDISAETPTQDGLESTFNEYLQKLNILLETLVTLFKDPSAITLNPDIFADCPMKSTRAWKEWKDMLNLPLSLTPSSMEAFREAFPSKMMHLTRPDRVSPTSKWSVHLKSSNPLVKESFESARACLTFTLQDLAELHQKIRFNCSSLNKSYDLPPLPTSLTHRLTSFGFVLKNFERKVNGHLAILTSSKAQSESISNLNAVELTIMTLCKTYPSLVAKHIASFIAANQGVQDSEYCNPPDKCSTAGSDFDSTPTQSPESTRSRDFVKYANNRAPDAAVETAPVQNTETTSPTSLRKSKRNRKRRPQDAVSKATPARTTRSRFLADDASKRAPDEAVETAPVQNTETTSATTLRRSKRNKKSRPRDADSKVTPAQSPESTNSQTPANHAKKRAPDADSAPVVIPNIASSTSDAETYSSGRLTIYLTAQRGTCLGCTYSDGRTSRLRIRENGKKMVYRIEGKPRNVRCVDSPQCMHLPTSTYASVFPPLSVNQDFFLKRDSNIYVEDLHAGKTEHKRVPDFEQDFVLRMCILIERLNILPKILQEVKSIDREHSMERCQFKSTGKYYMIMLGDRELLRILKSDLVETTEAEQRIVQMALAFFVLQGDKEILRQREKKNQEVQVW